jgi:LysM repeat protein
LTDSQKAIALKQLELDQLKAATTASGQPTLPEPAQPPPAPPTRPHVIGQTETAAGLAKLYGLSMSTFQAANPNVDLNNLKPGDVIRIPQPASPEAGPQLIIPPGNR